MALLSQFLSAKTCPYSFFYTIKFHLSPTSPETKDRSYNPLKQAPARVMNKAVSKLRSICISCGIRRVVNVDLGDIDRCPSLRRVERRNIFFAILISALRRIVLRHDFELEGKFEFNREMVTRAVRETLYMGSAAKDRVKFCTSRRDLQRGEITISRFSIRNHPTRQV